MEIFFQPSLLSNLPLLRPIACVAHRGNSVEAPENTLIAFDKALEVGADFLEVDVHLTKDDVPVILHDLILKRTISGYPTEAPINDLNFEQLEALDAGEWFGEAYRGTKIPSLAELIRKYSQKIGLMIEIKATSASPEVLVRKVLETIDKELNGQKRNIYVGSLSPEILQVLRTQASAYPLIAIVEEEAELSKHLATQPAIVALSQAILTPKLLRELKQAGKTVWVWTVDDPQKMHHFIQLGVDGVISNSPRELKQVIAIAQRK